MILAVSRLVLSLRHKLSVAEVGLVKSRDLDLVVMGLRDAVLGESVARVFVESGGFEVIKGIMEMRHLSTRSLSLLRLLILKHANIGQLVFTAGFINRAVMLCQRSADPKLHSSFVKFLCALAVSNTCHTRSDEDSAVWTVSDGILQLLDTQCLACKATAIKSLMCISLDTASSRNLFLGELTLSRIPSEQGKHWSFALLPQLFRMIVDRSSFERQFQAAEGLVLLTPLNSREVANLLTILFSLEVLDHGREFLASCHRWRVRDAAVACQPSTQAPPRTTFYEHAVVGSWLLSRVIELVEPLAPWMSDKQREQARGQEILRALRASRVHLSMLLFSLVSVMSPRAMKQAETADRASEDLVREASEAQRGVCSALQIWLDEDEDVRLEVYELLALHRLPARERRTGGGLDIFETINDTESRGSLAAQALVAKLRIESNLKELTAWLTSKYLQRACEQDSKGFPPLLVASSLSPSGSGDNENAEKKALDEALKIHLALQAHPVKSISKAAPHHLELHRKKPSSDEEAPALGYTQIADLFDTSSQENAIVSDVVLGAALAKLEKKQAIAVTSQAHPRKQSAAEEYDRPWRIKKKVLTWDEQRKKLQEQHEAVLKAQQRKQRQQGQDREGGPEERPENDDQPVVQRQQWRTGPPAPGPPDGSKARERGISPRAGGAFLRFHFSTATRDSEATDPVASERLIPPKKFIFGGVSLDVLGQLAESEELLFLTQEPDALPPKTVSRDCDTDQCL